MQTCGRVRLRNASSTSHGVPRAGRNLTFRARTRPITMTAWSFYGVACALGCEGIVSKRLGSPSGLAALINGSRLEPSRRSGRREREIDWAKR